MNPKSIILIAAILGGISIIMGAMGAHALKAVLEPEALQSYLTGARYNMYHAIALLAIAGNTQYLDPKWMKISVVSTLIGVILFSGSIYILSTKGVTGLSNISFLGPITPLGGLFLIFGWFSIGISALKK